MTTTASSEVKWKDGRLWVDGKNRVDGAGELKDYHSELRSQVEGEGRRECFYRGQEVKDKKRQG